MDIVSVAAITILTAFLAVILKQYKPEYALAVSVVASVIILSVVVSFVVPIISELRNMMDSVAIDYNYITVLIKAVGICYITQFASDTCKDAGQTAISNKIEMVGKIAICFSAIPLYKDLLSLAQTIIGKAM